jgi:hypothetical protein
MSETLTPQDVRAIESGLTENELRGRAKAREIIPLLNSEASRVQTLITEMVGHWRFEATDSAINYLTFMVFYLVASFALGELASTGPGILTAVVLLPVYACGFWLNVYFWRSRKQRVFEAELPAIEELAHRGSALLEYEEMDLTTHAELRVAVARLEALLIELRERFGIPHKPSRRKDA